MSEQTNKDDLIGKALGQYQIVEEIGRGGMATVYRAVQLSINRTVAVKVLPRHLLHDPGFFERFEREVDVIAHLEHPHILPIYDYGKAEGVPYIAMRYLAGGSLAQIIRRGLPKLEDLDRPFTQVAQGLDHAHRQGIIHRDLKPGNVMLDENGNAYLSDFGIARVLGSNLTGSMIIGTPAYMSPEQANGFPLDARSDLYSLGIVLFELITGHEPYQAETPMALLLKHINEPIPPLRNYRNDISPLVEYVIIKATAKDPNDRYTSASEMAREFSEAVRQKVTPQPMVPLSDALISNETRTPYPTPAQTPYLSSKAPTPPAAVPAPQPPLGGRDYNTLTETVKKRSPLPLILGVTAVLALLVIAGVAVLPSITNPTPAVTMVAATLPVPTPFARAQMVEANEYTISVPEEWVPSPQGSQDLSDEKRVIHLWQEPNLNSYVALIIPNDTNIKAETEFRAAVSDYARQFYAGQEHLNLIDESVEPDGTVRRSYRMVNAPNPPYPPGQLDVFFLNRAPKLVVLEMYSADSTGNTLVGTFQQILDSLRVKPRAS